MLALALESPPMQLQRTFAEAILSGDAPIPATIREASGPAHASRFGVYRNNVIAGLINAVSARYPVVRKLLWDDAFNRVAHQYVVSEPPRSPVLLRIWRELPAVSCAASDRGPRPTTSPTWPRSNRREPAPITPPTRRRCRGRHSTLCRPTNGRSFASMLHPSVALLKSDFPVVSIWQANLYANDNTLDVWKPECALIARPHLEVEVRIISAGVYEFIAALADGQTVGAAIAHGLRQGAGFRPRRMLQCPDLSRSSSSGLERRPSACS